MLANDEKQVTQLLELGAQSSVGDRAGVTPVMSAAEHGHIEVLQTLALKGINAGGGSTAESGPETLGKGRVRSTAYVCACTCTDVRTYVYHH